jgi:hypothetical protein
MTQAKALSTRLLTAMLPALSLLAACEREVPEPAAEAPVEETTYELVRTQAGELPALLGEAEGCRYMAAAGAVTLTGDRQFYASMIRMRSCEGEMTADTIMDTGGGRYRIEGDSLYFQYGGGGSAGVGLLAGDSLVVRGPGQTLTYRRTDF